MSDLLPAIVAILGRYPHGSASVADIRELLPCPDEEWTAMLAPVLADPDGVIMEASRRTREHTGLTVGLMLRRQPPPHNCNLSEAQNILSHFVDGRREAASRRCLWRDCCNGITRWAFKDRSSLKQDTTGPTITWTAIAPPPISA